MAAELTPGFDYVVIAGDSIPRVPFATLVSWLKEAQGPDDTAEVGK
jgi:hypothetical protein